MHIVEEIQKIAIITEPISSSKMLANDTDKGVVAGKCFLGPFSETVADVN